MNKRVPRRLDDGSKLPGGRQARPPVNPSLFLGVARAAVIAAFFAGTPGEAQTNYALLMLQKLQDSQDAIISLSLIVGLVLFSTITALLYVREHRRWTRTEAAFSLELNHLRAKLDRAEMFLSAEPHVIIAWAGFDEAAEIEGDLSLIADTPVSRRILGFSAWLRPEAAQQLEACVEKLRARGEGFHFVVDSLAGRTLEIDGRAVSGRAVMRVRDVSGDRLETVRLRERIVRARTELEALRAMLDAIPDPVWVRSRDGKLAWVNGAYVSAVEAQDSADALLRGTELLERQTRDAAALARGTGAIWRGRAPAVAAGQRRLLDIIDVPAVMGSVGMASDISDIEAIRADLDRQMKAHARTLDQLSTAVAIFDSRKRLVFYNTAYRQLWLLDQAFVEQRPSDSEILDRLRAAGLLPEQADFRAWKEGLFTAYQAIDTSEHVWYLPDGRTLRVVVNPNPQGGVTYLFDDVTERFHLESQFNALTRVQSETLDTLKEGVAVFGTDGRLKFFNPAFAGLLRLDAGALNEKPHIDRLAALRALFDNDQGAFAEIRATVVGLNDQRTGHESRISCPDGSVLDCAAQPLPDGATLLTFTDTTASVNVERALTERNQALMKAEQLRNDFVHHVSYELRSPLTNIIGFIELLNDKSTGPLNERQREYAGYVTKSSAALLAIIDNILDLASIDADALELSLEEVEIEKTMRLAAEGVQDRLAESSIHLQVIAMDWLGSFTADGQRIRQVLYNLLSNAIGFSTPGQTVVLAALRREDEIIFKVSDQGRGISSEVLNRVFGRFTTQTTGSRHRGAGLGLSIVRALVELHGGRVLIDSVQKEGTTVTCIFPTRRREDGQNQDRALSTRVDNERSGAI